MKPLRVLARPSARVRPVSCSTSFLCAGARLRLFPGSCLRQLARFFGGLGGLARLVFGLAAQVGDLALVAGQFRPGRCRRRVSRQRRARGLQRFLRRLQILPHSLLASDPLGRRGHFRHRDLQFFRLFCRKLRRRLPRHQCAGDERNDQRRHHQHQDGDDDLRERESDQVTPAARAERAG
jgi:hypothetical protein